MEVALFLGAGASVAFAKLTTGTLKNNLKEKFGNTDVKADLNFIRKLIECQQLTDFEYVLQAAKDIESFLNTDGGRFFNYLGRQPSLLFNKNQHQQIQFNLYTQNWKEDVVKKLEQVVFQYYSWDHNQDGILQTVYDSIFATLKQHSKKITIFTTNYDKAIERYCNIADYRLVDGFRRNRDDYVWKEGEFYYPTLTSESEVQKYVYLYKLHGSLNWKKHAKAAIIRSTEEGKSSDPNIKDNLLIYPTLLPKSGSGEPFGTILNEFKKRMVADIDVCVIIGFSFRNEHINEVFKDFASRSSKGKKRRRLIVVSPTAKQDFFGNLVRNGNQPQIDAPLFHTGYKESDLTIINKRINTFTLGEIVNDINDGLKSCN
jgi:hypothetical protein